MSLEARLRGAPNYYTWDCGTSIRNWLVRSCVEQVSSHIQEYFSRAVYSIDTNYRSINRSFLPIFDTFEMQKSPRTARAAQKLVPPSFPNPVYSRTKDGKLKGRVWNTTYQIIRCPNILRSQSEPKPTLWFQTPSWWVKDRVPCGSCNPVQLEVRCGFKGYRYRTVRCRTVERAGNDERRIVAYLRCHGQHRLLIYCSTIFQLHLQLLDIS